MALKTVFLVVVLVCFLSNATAARGQSRSEYSRPGHNIASRLQASGGLAECWTALNELKSCTSEIVLYLVNGQTDIGPECCRAVEIITRNCWPSMLTSLGFTPEEGNVLRGYCDASSAPAADPPHATVH
ncbi:Egg cell-secreted protein 1.4 [Hibiscus syriacus]|uniref:Egg cell-secreted protein 1.4 n=1 Tax=Hibiscus syriacus TaxID=106335 RepID=A0A6A2Y9Q6_HIBSY|nr:egg cell-secreted protein 1.4-like [Hibiscus syriacus]KAE8670819.1 Egg cell-secreted protein 1.4 [Hibiscus syriacus]